MATDSRASAARALSTASPATFLGELRVQEDALTHAISLLSPREKSELARSWSRRALTLAADTKPDQTELDGLRQLLDAMEALSADGEALKERLWQLDTSKTGPHRTDTSYMRYLQAANSVTRCLETAYPAPWTDESESSEAAQSRTLLECFFCSALASPNPVEEAGHLFESLAMVLRGL